MNNNFSDNFEIITTDDGIKLRIRVIPNASRCEVVGVVEKDLKIKLDVPPIEGKANEKCIKFLAGLLGIPKSTIFIIKGEKSKSKTVFIKGNPTELESKIRSRVG